MASVPPAIALSFILMTDGIRVILADENYRGKTQLCAKCKTMYAVIEKPKVAMGYVAIPIVTM